MSFSLLSLGWTGLNVSRLLAETSGHNTSNVNTPGYSRQRVELSARSPLWAVPGMLGTGAQATSISSLRDLFIEKQLLGAGGEGGFAGGQIEALQAAETAIGVGGGDRLQQALGGFFQALSALAAQPSDLATREQVLAGARELAQAFRDVRAQLQSSRQGLDDQIEQSAAEVQKNLEEIARLNREIRAAETAGVQANDLRDRRGLLAQQVAEQLGVRVFSDDRGNLNLALADGAVLVEGDQAAELRAVKDPANDGLMALELVSGSGVVRHLDAAAGGRLGGLLQARDVTLRQALEKLDGLAFDLASAVNNLHRGGFGLDGVGGRDLFTPLAGPDGAAGQLALDPAVDGNARALAAASDPAALPGDNRVALLLAGLASAPIASGGTQDPISAASGIGSFIGGALASAERDFEFHAGRIAQLSAWRESVSGVSLEEEMIELAKAQRAFEAATKVIKTADELLETVISLKG